MKSKKIILVVCILGYTGVTFCEKHHSDDEPMKGWESEIAPTHVPIAFATVARDGANHFGAPLII